MMFLVPMLPRWFEELKDIGNRAGLEPSLALEQQQPQRASYSKTTGGKTSQKSKTYSKYRQGWQMIMKPAQVWEWEKLPIDISKPPQLNFDSKFCEPYCEKIFCIKNCEKNYCEVFLHKYGVKFYISLMTLIKI